MSNNVSTNHPYSSRRKLAVIAAAAVLVSSLTGCVVVDRSHHGSSSSDWQERQQQNRETITTLDIGMQYGATRALFSSPDFSETFQSDNKTYKILYYRTHSKHSDGETSKDECTPLVFENGVLIGWGEHAVQSL